ncbi:MAG: hypothetical protein N2170_05785 [Bacteroidia bacterium]|nr:hypothetical protein [Bacteroidia bacterium]
MQVFSPKSSPPSLKVRLLYRVPLLVRDSSSVGESHWVRAASGLLADDKFLWIIQDDTPALIRFSAGTAAIEGFPLFPGMSAFPAPDPKPQKLDLEAATWVPPFPSNGAKQLLLFGSGSRPYREKIASLLLLNDIPSEISLSHAPHLYALLRAFLAPSAELNIEGVVWLPDTDVLRFFQRGTPQTPNATCDLPWNAVQEYLQQPERASLPSPLNLYGYELGTLSGVPLSFTDATYHPAGIFYTAVAEATDNAYEDGPVIGSVVGWIDTKGALLQAPLRDADGALLPIKVEGIARDPHHPYRFYLVTDPDDASQPSELLWIEVDMP